MKDADFVKEYEDIQPELDVIRAIVEARTSQNMTQKELAERTGINQADISKLENGTRNPSVNLLKRLAEGMGMVLKIEFVPKCKCQYKNVVFLSYKHVGKPTCLYDIFSYPQSYIASDPLVGTKVHLY